MIRNFVLEQIEKDVRIIDKEYLPRWDKYKTAPYEIDCLRLAEYGTEKIFVVAAQGQDVIVYDDVEEEFGIGTIDPDGILRHWEIYAGIDSCIKCFPGGIFYSAKQSLLPKT